MGVRPTRYRYQLTNPAWFLLRSRFGFGLVLRKSDHVIRTDLDWIPGCADLRVLGTCGEYSACTNDDFSTATSTRENTE